MKNVFAVLGIIIGAVILLMIVAMVVMVIIVNNNNAYKGDHQQLLKGINGKKALVVYQPSLSSTSKALGLSLAKGMNEAGYEVTVSYPSKHLSGDVSGYDMIIMGTTVFAAQPSKLIAEFGTSVQGADGKKVVVYSLGGLAEAPELDTLAAYFKDAAVIKHKFVMGSDVKDSAYQFGLNIDKE